MVIRDGIDEGATSRRGEMVETETRWCAGSRVPERRPA